MTSHRTSHRPHLICFQKPDNQSTPLAKSSQTRRNLPALILLERLSLCGYHLGRCANAAYWGGVRVYTQMCCRRVKLLHRIRSISAQSSNSFHVSVIFF
ncbi:hypothetical protein K443DRAFT_395300 [Laccaria amethystina LaAM-08-1]|uniref:Uncharacterized protein n=1 Tax=Laccaria amethystina LaAM-08-1 TaxID=1095629 RepID=A0A0C9XBH9_9AGAR|nr:hypothetical protein K443DRAFT_395300 [Laccaria amethystina LaAM-08-1]